MSYKTELQSNNTDIQTIETYLNEFGSLIAGQDNLIAQIKAELQGKAISRNSSEPSVDDIGVFTLSRDGTPLNISFLFIKGMTFKEFCSSKMNKTVYDDNGFCGNLFNGKTHIEFSTESDSIANYYGNISADGLIECDENTAIEETNYQLINGW